MGLTEKLKREAHFMKMGAKVLPKVAGQKVKGWAKGQWELAKQRAIAERQIQAEERAAEQGAFREARIEAARARGIRKGIAKAKEGGVGILGQLGQIGENISVAETLGIDMGKQKRQKDMGSAGSYIFQGLGQAKIQPQAQRREVHHYHHYPKKKKR